MTKCNHCEGKGWVWEKGCDTSEDCSWCKGTGKLVKTLSHGKATEGRRIQMAVVLKKQLKKLTTF